MSATVGAAGTGGKLDGPKAEVRTGPVSAGAETRPTGTATTGPVRARATSRGPPAEDGAGPAMAGAVTTSGDTSSRRRPGEAGRTPTRKTSTVDPAAARNVSASRTASVTSAHTTTSRTAPPVACVDRPLGRVGGRAS